MQLAKGKLVLATGETFFGELPSAQTEIALGEIVFNTGMVGYVESLTDPSYAGQILVFTYPLIGNYGISNPDTWESSKIQVKGVIMSSLAHFYSSHSANQSLLEWLNQYNIPFLVNVDTRALTKRLRTQGVIPGSIMPVEKNPTQFENFEDIDWVKEVSIKEPSYHGSGEKLIIAVDCGMKSTILRNLLKFPLRIKCVPYDYDFSEEKFDGIFISNGPGDPIQCKKTIHILQKALQRKKPTFGICLGTQLLALAVGAKTYKLPFGHRAQNQPCMDLNTNRCYLTSQNHSYAVDETTLPADWKVSFRNLNDQSVEGIEHRENPFFAVQFHPEAGPGPLDAEWLFQKFYDLLINVDHKIKEKNVF